jgi:hypothetical protein
MKPTSSFKLSKQTKRSLALIIDPHKRGEQRRMMVQAELAGAVKHKPEKRNTNFAGKTE